MHHSKSDMAAIVKIVALFALYCACLQNPAEGHPLQKQCYISKYRRMQADTMAAARDLQNQMKLIPSCRQGLRLKKFKSCDIKGKERLMLTVHRLSLVVNVLENMNKTELVTKNLETFSILRTDLNNCEMSKSPKLKACQRHLNQYKKKVTKDCLENDVLKSLIWILTADVGYLFY